MTKEEIIESVEIGNAILNELFAMNDADLKQKISEIVGHDYDDILKHNCDCVRTIRNEEPEKIEFWFYDGLIIQWFGISYQPEHGPEKRIVNFNKFFKLS